VNISLERLGDRWWLPIIGDRMIRGAHTLKDFQQSGKPGVE
jgi:hypothetical protein